MRVGHLVASYLPVTENWIHGQITACDAIESFVLNRGDRLNDGLFPVRRAWHLCDLGGEACRAEADAWEAGGCSRVFIDAFRSSRGDLLHAHFGAEGVLGVPLAAALGVPLVTSFYGYDASVLPRDPAWNRALRRLFAAGTLFMAEGPALAETLIRLGCPPERVRVSPLPVRIPARPARPRCGEAPLILVCGRFVAKKGIDVSLRVLARLRKMTGRPFRALIVGDGPAGERLLSLHARLGIGDIVRFAGSVPPAEFDRLLGGATALLQMSRTAPDGDSEGGAPVVISQALAAGVPVVSTRHCDIPWIVEDGRSGFIVDSDDIAAAAGHLARVIARSDLQRSCASAGRESARRRLSARSAGETLGRHYADALALGPVSSKARGVCLHAGLFADVVLDLRRRAGDADGLARMAASTRLDRDRRGHAHRAAGQACEQRADHVAAAMAFRRWRRLTPASPHAGLEEGRAWLRSQTPARAVAPLAQFIRLHESRAYAIDVAMTAVETLPEGGAELATALMRRAGTPAECFTHAFKLLCPVADTMAPRAARLGLRRALAHLGRVTAEPGPLDAALVDAYLLALRLDDAASAARLEVLLEPGRVSEPVLRYRLASALAGRVGAKAAWARRTFEQLANRKELAPDSRAGALFHLAEIDHHRGLTRQARRALDRCLAIAPTHGAASRLRAMLLN